MFSNFVNLMFIVLLNLHCKRVVICIPTLNGQYTEKISEYFLTVPHKITKRGEFFTFKIPHYYDHDFGKRKKKRSLDNFEVVHYAIYLNKKIYTADLWPNHGFIAPNIISESRQPNIKVQKRKIKRLDSEKMCHYTGHIRDNPDSKVALSTCDGLAGYITIRNKRYFIEPLQEHVPNDDGQHLHIIYERSTEKQNLQMKSCGTSDNWKDAWKKRFYEKYQQKAKISDNKEKKRGLSSVHRYLETVVVCDKKFIKHHKNTDIETYVLTIMNMVADFYHDYSSGNQMNVVVVRIIYLEKEEEEIDLVINADADKTLASFCKWQQKINPKDLSNPNHHDIAVLLTRYDICSDNLSNCGLMGLAYVASACTGNEPCAINEDGGLVLGIVVAHEMGHVMGCAHDKEGESDCAAQDKDGSFFVMAPYVHLFTTRWSTCSRGFITSLFENNLGECLNDEPEVSLYKNRDMLPGIVYDADQQCQMTFPKSTVCIVDNNEFCKELLCRTSPRECLSNGEPPADGTKCGNNMWCYRKKCVEIGERPLAINGGWGEWGVWSKCSRTCGGGVTMAERECNNPIPQNKGRYCIGDRKKVKICNLHIACPVGSPSFRELQCQKHDNKPFQDKLYTWKSYFMAEEPCVLYCLNNDNGFAKLEPRAKDGTRCKPGTKNMCISGTCRNIGCDGEIDSKAVEDVCGICNGDGTQCKIIDEVYNGNPGRKYKKIAVIPAGSLNILIEELKSSVNTIAITDSSETNFLLNGNFAEQQDGAYKFGNVEGVYSHPEPGKESLIIHGPLSEDVVFFICFYTHENVGYHYKYSEATIDTTYEPKYHWELLDWDECSVRCGGGVQNALFFCVEEKSGKVSESFCTSVEIPDTTSKKCNEQLCKTKWRVGKWGSCHACKFKSGVKIREVECVKESPHPGAEDILVEDRECAEKKPGTRQLCNSHKKCKERTYTDGLPDHMMKEIWKQTNKDKLRARNVVNQRLNDRHKKKLHKKTCMQTKSKQKLKVKVGDIVKDTIPKEEIKLIKVPLKESHLSLNLSDEAFETMGDKIADSDSVKKEKIVTGETAAEMLKNLQHSHKHRN